MTDNAVRYGFRFVRNRFGGTSQDTRLGWVATGTSFDVSGGASNVVLGEGDPLVQVSDGSVTLAVGNETTPSTTCVGICVGIKQYYDSAKGVMTALGPGIPSDLAWGTNLARRSELLYVPVDAAVWAIQCDDASTFTTEALYQAAIGENVSHILTGASGALRASPKLDISTHATTNTLVWKIVGIGKTANNQDYTGNNVELHVICNLSSDRAILGI